MKACRRGWRTAAPLIMLLSGACGGDPLPEPEPKPARPPNAVHTPPRPPAEAVPVRGELYPQALDSLRNLSSCPEADAGQLADLRRRLKGAEELAGSRGWDSRLERQRRHYELELQASLFIQCAGGHDRALAGAREAVREFVDWAAQAGTAAASTGPRPRPDIPEDCPLRIDFASYGAGIDHAVRKAVEALLARESAVTAVQQHPWGREGEVTLCVRVTGAGEAERLFHRIAQRMPSKPRGPVGVSPRAGLRFSRPPE